MRYFHLPLIVLLALLLTQSSCHKKLDHTVVEGFVVNRYSGDPIPDATIALIQSDPDDLWGFNYHTVANFPVDNNGYFKFEMKDEYNKYDGMYYVGAISDSGYFRTDWDSIKRINEYERNHKILKLTPPARLRVNVNRTSGKYRSLALNEAACWGQYRHPNWNIRVFNDTSIILCDGLRGNDSFKVHYELFDYNNAERIELYRNVFIPPGGTGVAEIEF